MEYIKMNVTKAMPYIFELVKKTAIHRTIGKKEAWMYLRIHGEIQWNEKTIKILNEGLWEIGETLLHTKITFSTDDKYVVEQVKNVCKIVKSSNFYKTLNRSEPWWKSCLRNDKKTLPGSHFSENDIAIINMCIISIANKLVRIQLFF